MREIERSESYGVGESKREELDTTLLLGWRVCVNERVSEWGDK